MPYSPTTWVSGTTPASAPNMNNIETGISGAYTELESITANDGTALPSSNGPFTLANFINYLTTLVKSIVGGAHWYSAVPTSLTSLSTGKADLSGATFTGAVSLSNVQAQMIVPSAPAASVAAMNAIVSGDTSTRVGFALGGTSTAQAGSGYLFVSKGASGNITRLWTDGTDLKTDANGGATQTVWHSGNDGSGSGLDADKLDGVQGSGYALVGSHSAGQVIISYGTGVPAALAANEIYIQLS